LIVLVLCFAVTGMLILAKSKATTPKKEIPLTKALAKIPGWRMTSPVPLDPRIARALKLDDYINANFSNGKNTVSLYIGYYFSDKKLGAAHDPMVCFPGQGWTLSKIDTGLLQLQQGKNSDNILFSIMVANKGDQKQLIIYWFQSYDKTNTNTFSQKVSSFFERVTHRSEGNAFVRIITSLNGQTRKEAQKTVENFIRAFYPLFLKYIKDETRCEPQTING